jgi:purine nucleoside phosphorylase
MPQAKIGVIGGSGLYDIEGLRDIKEVNPDTPRGMACSAIFHNNSCQLLLISYLLPASLSDFRSLH